MPARAHSLASTVRDPSIRSALEREFRACCLFASLVCIRASDIGFWIHQKPLCPEAIHRLLNCRAPFLRICLGIIAGNHHNRILWYMPTPDVEVWTSWTPHNVIGYMQTERLCIDRLQQRVGAQFRVVEVSSISLRADAVAFDL